MTFSCGLGRQQKTPKLTVVVCRMGVNHYVISSRKTEVTKKIEKHVSVVVVTQWGAPEHI